MGEKPSKENKQELKQRNTFTDIPLNPSVWRERLTQDEYDLRAYNLVQNLRLEAEPKDQWRKLKLAAQTEIASLPPDIIGKLIEKAKPFLEALPAAHSKGHFARDLVNLTAILHDPEVQTYGDVEIMVGILGGIFHDIGNSVVDRYDENKRFAGHAEVGAVLFGELAKQVFPPNQIPENLIKMVQFAIAAHVNVPEKKHIAKPSGEITRYPYDNKIEGNDKRGMWLARLSDRLEIQSIIQLIRLTLANARPIEDNTGADVMDVVRQSPQEQFLHKFSINLNEPGGILYTLLQYIATARGAESPHTKYDPSRIQSEILRPAAAEIEEFITAFTQVRKFTADERRKIFDDYLQLSKRVEPGSDIDAVLAILRERLNDLETLPEEEQNRWAVAVSALTRAKDGIYAKWHTRMSERTHDVPSLGSSDLQETTIAIIADLHTRARAVLDALDPNNPTPQDLVQVLIK